MAIKDDFEKAQADVKTLTENPTTQRSWSSTRSTNKAPKATQRAAAPASWIRSGAPSLTLGVQKKARAMTTQ
jgi:hypothetical protein